MPRSPSWAHVLEEDRLGHGQRSRAVAATAAALAVFPAALVHVGQQRQLAGALDGRGDLALVPSAGAGDAPRADLALLGDEPAQAGHVLVIDLLDLVSAVRTWLAPAAPGPPFFSLRTGLPRPRAFATETSLYWLLAERNVVVARAATNRCRLEVAIIDGDVARPGAPVTRESAARCGIITRAQELDRVGDDLDRLALARRPGPPTRATRGVRRPRRGVPWPGTGRSSRPARPRR